MSLIEKIKADREAGTPGKWDWSGGDGPTNPNATANIGIWSEHRLNEAYEAEIEDPDDEKWIAGIWGAIDGEDCANARRIARVPEMEAALLAWTEAMAEANEAMEMGDPETAVSIIESAYREATA